MNSTRSKRRGSTMATSGCTVRAYFLEQMNDSEKRRVVREYPAITCLERFLGRPALLKDLSDKTLVAFFDWLSESAGLGQRTISYYQRKILAIGRHAAERSIIDHPMPTWECRVPMLARTSEDNGWLCLCRYFDEVYLADHSQLTAETLKAYRSAIRCFERFVKDRPSVQGISQPMIKQFRQWLLDNGFNAKKAGNNAFAVAAIVKHARPERFLEEAAELDPAVDPERALEYVFTNKYLPAKLKIASDKTAMKYVASFRSFGRFLGHVATLDDLTDENLGRWMRSIRGEGCAARTVNGYRSKLIAIWNWCARKRFVENFSTVEKMPEPLTLPCAWTGDQLRSLMAACYRTNGTIADIPAGDWWPALHLVAWDTGERTGALLGLRWDMLNPQTAQLAVPAEFRKGGRKPMLYHLKPATLSALERIASPERELIFPFPADRSQFYARYKRLLKAAGLPYVRRKSAMQKMRRSFATHLEAAGGDATVALAHSLRSITSDSYLDPRLIERTPPNELLFPLAVASD